MERRSSSRSSESQERRSRSPESQESQSQGTTSQERLERYTRFSRTVPGETGSSDSETFHDPFEHEDRISTMNSVLDSAHGIRAKGLHITNEQYQEMKESIDILYKNEYINMEARNKAKKAVYNASEKGQAARAKYHTSEVGREKIANYNASEAGREAKAKYEASEKGQATRAKYHTSEVVREAKAKYEASEKGQAAKDAFYKRKELLSTEAGRQQLLRDYTAWMNGEVSLPQYIPNPTFHKEFLKKHEIIPKSDEEE